MILIQTEQDLERMRAAPRAIVFVFFDWSGQAKMSEQLVKTWEKDWLVIGSFRDVPFFRLEPDRFPFIDGWLANAKLADESGLEGGYGSITWLARGTAVCFVRYAAIAGAETLSQITGRVFAA